MQVNLRDLFQIRRHIQNGFYALTSFSHAFCYANESRLILGCFPSPFGE